MNRDEISSRLTTVFPDSEAAVELSSMLIFEELGWDIIYAEHEIDGDESLLGRSFQGDVILDRYLVPALKKFNHDIPETALHQAIEVLKKDRSAMSLAKASQDVYQLIKQGIRIDYRDSQGKQKIDRVKVIDWDHPEENHFLLVSQLWVKGPMHQKRPDLVGFVNGIPLLFMELKEPSVNLKHAYQDNLRDYKDTIPHLLWYNGIVLLSNGRQAKAGSITAEWEHFADWKKINDEGEVGIIDLDTLIRAICPKERLLDIIENFTVFQEAAGGTIKLVAKNHQYLGVNNAIKAVAQVKEREGHLGVFWHTQGSGKSASMMFFSQKVLRKIPGNWTFVIITDRIELDNQIYETFHNSEIITEDHVQATSTRNLRDLLSEDHRFIFTLIHKFQTRDGEKHPVLSDRDDIIIITDEAHRSQYDTLAQNMRDALPNAAFLGFTGTPLIKGEEEKTRQVFGEYVSIYNFTQSIADGATVPLYYENRIPEVELTTYGEEHMNDDMSRIIDEAMLDDSQEQKLERYFSRMYHIVTRDDRLEKVAKDIVEHFMGRGHMGKAMVVAIDKATAIRLYDKVRLQWIEKIANLHNMIDSSTPEEKELLSASIKYMEETDMAVVISSSQNEIDDMRKKGLDIRPHRRRMVNEELDVKFKDSTDPLRIVFVCAMWMTGFDVPSCSTIYLDKPMKNHTLMQTIARANRVFKDKPNGLIVDYVGIFRNLEKALAIYANPESGDGEPPIKDKQELKSLLQQTLDDTIEFARSKKVDLREIMQTTDILLRTKLKEEAVDALIESKKEFIRLAEKVNSVYKAYLPDPIEPEMGQMAYLIRKIVKQMRPEEVDISFVTDQVDYLLDQCVQGYEIRDEEDDSHIYDLSQLDFFKLREKFNQGRKRLELDRLKNLIEKKLEDLLMKNRTRMDFLERYREMIREYVAGTRSLDEIFNQLLKFSHELKEEEQRFVREGLDNEEELSVFDLLTKPEITLSEKEIKQVKQVARSLLNTLKTQKLVLDWRKKQQTRAGVKLAISEILDELPPAYNKELYDVKCNMVYQYVYEM